jgi:hypothetical protein
MKKIKFLAGTVSLLTLVSVGYYGSLKSVERMYGISIGLITGGIFAQSIKNLSTKQSSTLIYQKARNLKQRRKVLKTLRASANLSQQRQTTKN